MIERLYKTNQKSKFRHFFFNIRNFYQEMNKKRFLFLFLVQKLTGWKGTRIVHNPCTLLCFIVGGRIIWKVEAFSSNF